VLLKWQWDWGHGMDLANGRVAVAGFVPWLLICFAAGFAADFQVAFLAGFAAFRSASLAAGFDTGFPD